MLRWLTIVMLLAPTAWAQDRSSTLLSVAEGNALDLGVPADTTRPKGDSGGAMATWCIVSLVGIGAGMGIVVGVDGEAEKGMGGAFAAIGLIGALYTCSNWGK